MATTSAVLRLGLGLAAGALLLGACGLPGPAQTQAHVEAATVTLEYLHAEGRGDAATMCALMSRDYQEKGFQDDGVEESAPCLAKATAMSGLYTRAERAEFVASTVDDIVDGAGRVFVRTTGSDPMTVEVISEGAGPKVDDAYWA